MSALVAWVRDESRDSQPDFDLIGRCFAVAEELAGDESDHVQELIAIYFVEDLMGVEGVEAHMGPRLRELRAELREFWTEVSDEKRARRAAWDAKNRPAAQRRPS